MFKVLNISDRNLVIGGFRIVPLECHIFDDRTTSVATKAKINSLSNLGLIKVSSVKNIVQPVKIIEPTKKTTRKSK